MRNYPLAFAALIAAALGVAEPLAQPPGQAKPGPSTTAIWSISGRPTGTPAQDGETAYFLLRTHEVMAVATTSGEVRWKSTTGVLGSDDLFGGATAGIAVTLAGDLVVAGDWDVVAFDRASGRRRWVYEAPGGDGPGLYLGEASESRIFTGSADGRVYGIDLATGRPGWTTRVVPPGPVDSTVYEPIVAGSLVAAGYTTHQIPPVGGVVALDGASGRVRWRTQFPVPPDRFISTFRGGGPLLVGDELIASAGDGSIYAFDLDTGVIRGRFQTFEPPPNPLHPSTDNDFRTLTRSGPVVIAGSNTGHIVAYDVETRAERWRHDASSWGSTTFSLSADDRLAYVPFWGGFIIALDLETGAERWRFGDYTMGFTAAPAPHGDRVYASGSRVGAFALATTIPERPQ